MNKRKWIVVGVLCLLVLLLAIAVVMILNPPTNPGKVEKPTQSQTEQTLPNKENTEQKPEDQESEKPGDTESEKPNDTESEKPNDTESEKPNDTQSDKPNKTDPDKPDNTDSDTKEETTTTPPEDLPPFVEIPDQDAEKEGLEFPCEVPGYDLVIEKLAPYTGLFVEDGTNAQVTDVAMLLIHNQGDSAVEYTEITVEYEEKTLVFRISALPAGESLVVQESTGSAVPEGTAQKASALVVQRAQMQIAPEISVTDNGDNTLTIQNLTDETIPTVRVFYKYYMEDENLFVGGIAFTLRITKLPGKGSITVQPSHYISKTSRVVMAQVYDTEV